jgi:pyruvate,water dikinase
MPRLLRRVESIVPRWAREYGGKARNLAALARAGFPVPAALALPGSVCTDVLSSELSSEDQPSALVAAGHVDPERIAALAEKVRGIALPIRIEQELRRGFEDLRRAGAHAVVVRSSSTVEDQEAASAAGLHATFLNVTTEDALLDYVRASWASLYSPRVIAYLREVADAPTVAMGVVIQALVPARVSGVVFTANPLTGDASEMVINASYGLGPAIVDGRVSPDTFRVDKASGSLRDRVVGDKELRTVPLEGGGVTDEPVPEEARRELSIDDAAFGELVALAQRVEQRFQLPQDIEWAEVGGQIYLLQSRPISTLPVAHSPRRAPRRTVDRGHLVWSNVNVGEALPGVATPLTWSVLSNFSELGFRRAFGSLGCSVPKDAELVGNFRGRIYLNLTEFSAILTQVPGLRPRTLLALGGGGEQDLLEEQTDRRSSAGFFLRLPLTATRFMRENYLITTRVEAFEAFFEEERRTYRDMDLRVLSPSALSKTLRDIEQLLDQSGAIMLTCYGNLLASIVALRGVLRLVAKGRPHIERGLLTGLADVDSAAPGLALWHIAEMARAEPAVAEVLTTSDPRTLTVGGLPAGPTRRSLEKFLLAYGFRGPREAEIATPRWREDPTLLFATLRAHLTAEDAERPVDLERRQRSVRERAAAELETLVPTPARIAVRHLLSLVQRFTRLRERLRAYVTEVLGMFRDVALDASRRLAMRDAAYGDDAAFFLTMEEVHTVLRGDRRSLVALVRRRRRHYERDRGLPDPPDTFVGYPPEAELPPPSTDALFGLAASSGVSEGLARVLLVPSDAADLRPGEVLVAPYADVGWSPLFLCASAVVTDLGGPLSHASVVAREYGVPMVVNVKVGTRTIATGDRIRVDGDTGAVYVVSRATPLE